MINALLLGWFFGSMAVAFGAWFVADQTSAVTFRVLCWATDSAIIAAAVILGATVYGFAAALGVPK